AARVAPRRGPAPEAVAAAGPVDQPDVPPDRPLPRLLVALTDPLDQVGDRHRPHGRASYAAPGAGPPTRCSRRRGRPCGWPARPAARRRRARAPRPAPPARPASPPGPRTR